MNDLSSLPVPAIAALVVLVIIQLSVEIYAIVDIIRRPADRITGGNKILWLLLVVFVNLVGAIVYLVGGRKPAVVAETPHAPSDRSAAREAVDTLYGGEDR